MERTVSFDHPNTYHMTDMTMDAPKRPTLLTVLCILSFIGGILGLWDGYKNAFTDAPQKALEEAKAQVQESMDQLGSDNPMAGMMNDMIATAEKGVENAKTLGYSNLAFSLISLAGVWMMWNLKKTGFWLYLLASIGGLAVMFSVLGGGGLFANITSILAVVITAVFIILYGVNLKHMR
ncbi:MAG TPA: hypothetical protein PKE53_17390 [Flavobacteriales bacterium]|nr:hypothetical protein [Flavobacteriales bacterium]MCC6654767.1 hypothetical protein [Flavobacteriales bacterium]HMU15766.1 hypothetical protein [Flavobacteriales bacterium]